MNIGIIFGGKSVEHEISIISAYQLKKCLDEEYSINLIYISLDGSIYNANNMELNDFKYNNLKKLKKLKLRKMRLDAVVGAMHGENGEDGLAEAFCRLNNLKYIGCENLAASLCIDKFRSYLYLKNNGINMIDTVLYTYEDFLNKKSIEFIPCIVKPNKGGSSIGIQVIKNEYEIEEKLSRVFIDNKEVVIQPYLEDFTEYNLALNERNYSNLEKINNKEEIFTFNNKYVDNFKVIHQELVEDDNYNQFIDISRKVYELVNASGIIRIDFFLFKDKIYVNEVNTTPGALAMYLFPNFKEIFKESLYIKLNQKDKKYEKSNFLLKNNITK